jgi:hypothetical protein
MILESAEVRTALKALHKDLQRAGYAEDERRAIVEGAEERVAAHYEADPDAPQSDALDLIASFRDPQLGPDPDQVDRQGAGAARMAWVALGLTAVGILGFAPVMTAIGSDGGAVMMLFAIIGLPVSALLAFAGRRTPSGRLVGVATLTVTALLTLMVAAAYI